MKRIIPFVIAISLLLTGCGTATAPIQQAADPQLISADALLVQLLTAVPEGDETPEIVPTDEHALYLTIYGIDSALVKNCAIARLGGARVFELAVIDLTAPSAAAEDTLLSYLLQRQGAFTGYAPDQAEIAANGKLFAVEGDCRLVLALTEDTRAVTGALTEAGYSKVTEISEARQWEDQPTLSPEPEASTTDAPEPESSFALPKGWHAYTDPGTDDMTIYKNFAILTAWETGSLESLLPKDRQTYERCVEIIAQCITEDMTDYEKEQAIYQWMIWNLSYDWRHQDPSLVTPRDSYQPYGALVEGTAVCLGFATTFQLFMDLLDIECITVVGAAFHSTEDHAWNMVKLDGEWYCVDVTWDLGKSMAHCDYFNVTSDYMAKTDHQWDYENTPMATATDGGQ